MAATATPAPTAHTTFGVLHGLLHSNWDGTAEAEAFLGIPYALEASGARRFASPVDWTKPYDGGARKSTEYGPVCPQARVCCNS